jgi:hypothetical protein
MEGENSSDSSSVDIQIAHCKWGINCRKDNCRYPHPEGLRRSIPCKNENNGRACNFQNCKFKHNIPIQEDMTTHENESWADSVDEHTPPFAHNPPRVLRPVKGANMPRNVPVPIRTETDVDDIEVLKFENIEIKGDLNIMKAELETMNAKIVKLEKMITQMNKK